MSEMLDDNNVKVGKILFLESTGGFYSYLSGMYDALKRFSDEIILFNRKDNYFRFGKEKMNEMLMELIKKKRPEYIFTWITWDEFYLETLLKIREVSPHTKTVVIFGDDIHQFDDFTRYYSLFFDYGFTTLKSYLPKYKLDGNNNIFFTSLLALSNFREEKIKKKYDVSFVGTPKDNKSRYDLIKYLIDNGINIKIFGTGWDKYPEFKEIYGGLLNHEGMVKVINESKINLCFSKNNFGHGQMKAKIFENGACKGFSLCEYAKDYLDYFNEEEIVFFNSKEELLEKVKYYLSNDVERDKIGNKSYQKIKNEYGLEKELGKFFNETSNGNIHKELPKIKGKSFIINNKHFYKVKADISKLIEDYDYISFKLGNSEFLPYKEYLQIYSLDKTNKNISCCNYYVHIDLLGDYLLFFSREAVNLLDQNSLQNFLNLNQIMVKKKYFLDHFEKFKNVFNGKRIDFVNLESTALVNIPLVRLNDYKLKGDYDKIKICFDFKFVYNLYSEIYQKKFFSLIPFTLFGKIISGDKIIYRALKDKIKEKGILRKFIGKH